MQTMTATSSLLSETKKRASPKVSKRLFGDALFLLLKLNAVKVREDALSLEQFVVFTLFRDTVFRYDNDPISVTYCREAMGDNQRCAVFC